MANKGWISIHRKITDHWLYKEKRSFSKFEAWLDILLEANHKDVSTSIQNTVLKVKKGQSINSLETWANRWNWNKSRVRRFLKMLEDDKMIKLRNEFKTTRLTICNYDDYQDNRNASETDTKRTRNASETQATPNNNVNNDNKYYVVSYFSKYAEEKNLDLELVLDQLDLAWEYYEERNWINAKGKPVKDRKATIRNNWFNELSKFKLRLPKVDRIVCHAALQVPPQMDSLIKKGYTIDQITKWANGE